MEVSTTTFITLIYSSAEGEELHLHWLVKCVKEKGHLAFQKLYCMGVPGDLSDTL